LIAAAIDGSKVIVGELAPLLLDPAFDLLPVSFNTVLVHDNLHRTVPTTADARPLAK
jgi:hypothetical protein